MDVSYNLGIETTSVSAPYLIYLCPAGTDAGYVKEHRTVFPERTLLDVVDKADSREVHVSSSFPLNSSCFCNIRWVGSIGQRTLLRNI